MPKFASLETLPEDARAVKNYNSHEFDELYYSPANKSFYQKTRTNKYKEINNKNNEDKQYVYARNNKNRSIRISFRKFAKENEIEDLYVRKPRGPRKSAPECPDGEPDKTAPQEANNEPVETPEPVSETKNNSPEIDLDGIVDFVV